MAEKNPAETLRETVPQKPGENRSEKALSKLCELVECGDKRIELSSAKEVLGLLGLPETIADKVEGGKLEVEIKIVE